MDEYIKREAALALVKPDAPEDEKAAVTIATAKKLVRSIVLRTPAADVAPVVHCRHCRSYNKPRLGWCSVHMDREGRTTFVATAREWTAVVMRLIDLEAMKDGD